MAIYKPFKPHTPLQVEATFDRFIETAGGTRVSNLVGSSPAFKNADYLFQSDHVVIELKELTTDWPKIAEFQQKISDLWLRCELAGRVSHMHASGQAPIPRDVRQEFFQLLRKPIKRVLEKANRQIRETRSHLCSEDASGVVLLVIDGLLTVAPEFLMAIVCKILEHNYSSISCLVAITVNEYVGIPGDDYARLLWMPAYNPLAPDTLVEFVNDLGRQWTDFLEKEIGAFDERSEVSSHTELAGARFIGRS